MKLKTIKIPTHNMSEEEWQEPRKNGIGGSEMGAVLQLDGSYQSKLEVYLRKIDENVYPFDGNKFTEAGKHDEDQIRKLSQFYPFGGDVMSMWDNYKSGKKVRKTRSYNYMLFAEKYPYIFANTDGLYYEGKEKGVLEIKTTTSHASRNYVGGLNPCYVAQCQVYLMLTGLEHVLLLQRVDGVDYDLYKFEADDEFQQHIIDTATNFWKNVVQARNIKKQYGIENYYGIPIEHFDSEQREGVAILQALEPELTGADREIELIRNMIQPTVEYSQFPGSLELLDLAKEYLEVQKKTKDLKEDGNIAKANIMIAMQGYHEAIFINDDDGKEMKVSYKPTSNGKSNRLYVSPKLNDHLMM